MIGAHPDDCEYDAGGTAALWAQSGFKVKFLAATNGELLPTLENRRVLTRKIREWRADVVVAHRPNDYHPDHRYTGILVQPPSATAGSSSATPRR